MPDLSVLWEGLLLTSIILAAIFSPALCYRNSNSTKNTKEIYHDEDGTATSASQFAFDRKTRLSVFVLILCTAIGFLVNVLAIILRRTNPETVSDRFQLLHVTLEASAAGLLVLEVIFVAIISSPADRQVQSTVTGTCSLFVYTANIGYDLQPTFMTTLGTPVLVSHIALLLASISICLTIPRRPDVFQLGNPEKAVDKERTVSILSRFTLSWANPLLSHAIRKGGLDFQDLPSLDARITTRFLVLRFNLIKTTRLWKHVVRAHTFNFVIQWILTLCYSMATFAPQYAIFQLIKILEKDSSNPDSSAILWLALLGLAQLLQPWIETWVLWVGWCHIALPIYIQLSGLIATKVMRKKDIKTFSTHANDLQNGGEDNLNGHEEIKLKTKKDSTAPAGSQEKINLITVDAKRLTDFLSDNSMQVLLGTVLNIVISFCFLLSFIRIENILVGLGGISLLVPLNIYANRRYNTAQNSLMKARDLKVAALTECIQGIRQVKFDALESQWNKKISAIRDAELYQQWKAYISETLLMVCWIAGPYMFAAITLSRVSIYDVLTPSVAFTALAIFQRLEATLSLVPSLFTDFADAWVSFGRLENFLASPERLDLTVDADSISFENASVAWPSDEKINQQYALHSLSFDFPKNALSIIAGPTGAGKSLLLSAIVGEADIINGVVRRPRSDPFGPDRNIRAPGPVWIIAGSISLVAQTAWIENASFRENILFSLPFMESRYMSVLKACALVQDIQTMEDGDMTEVGAHGISLSGGQRSRLSLARALYSRAEVLVIDDVLGAVDSHVARHILEQALVGDLAKDRTYILATHNVRLCLPKASFVVLLKHGGVEYYGSSEDCVHHLDSAGNISYPENRLDVGEPESPTLSYAIEPPDSVSSQSESGRNQSDDPTATDDKGPFDEADFAMENLDSGRRPKKLVEEEQRESGRIKLGVYKAYLRVASAWPWVYWLTVISLLIGKVPSKFFELALIGRNLLVKFWSEKQANTSQIIEHGSVNPNFKSENDVPRLLGTSSPFNAIVTTDAHSRNVKYVVGCILTSLLVSVLGVFKFYWVYLGSLRASRWLFATMMSAVLRAPIRWLDTTPTARILNRFLADFNVIDSSLADHLVSLILNGLQLGGIIAAGTLVSPFLVLISVPLLAICVIYARQYLAGARDVKRLESITRSPILDQLDSILSGLATIRAWDKSSEYIDRMYSRIDEHARCVWHLWLFNRWLGIRFTMIGAIFIFIVASFAVYSPAVSASLAGLALIFSLEFTQSVFWILRRYADMEMDMNSLERITEYCNIPAERSEGIVPPAHWPNNGRIEVSDLFAGYAADSPPVLRGVSFTCEPNSRTGIVGRTGAGKSSLTLSLFRFLEARAGSIVIDGLDISTLVLKELREGIAIIPQHPVLWLGTIRSNLDPFSNYDDVKLQDVLKRVQLSHQDPASHSTCSHEARPSYKSARSRPSFTLSTHIAEGGLNISLGQRQLICLARAILSRPKIIIMDEATSAVDADTDNTVQKSIRNELKNCTLIVIAHKLSTVIDFDKIIVLEAGTVVESGKPRELWEKGTLFTEMVRQSGDKAILNTLGSSQT